MKKISEICNIIKKYIKLPRDIIIKKKNKINIIGRIISKRNMGNIIFINIQDIKGNIQILINKKITEKKIIKYIKIGNIIYIKGILFKTNTKELTIKSIKIKIIKKINKYLPDKFHKLKNKETKFRKRYLDIIINKKTKKTFLKRIKIINLIRKYLNKNNFLEVETPMLHNIPGGAIAKPFITYHNKLNKNMYLRIAPELYLKRLLISGFNKIFELNRNFRNEGISLKHNPEFTMIEIYKTYSSYKYMMSLIEKIIFYILINIYKKNNIIFNKKKINFNSPYKILTLKQSILKYSKLFSKINDLDNKKKIKNIAKKLKINFDKKISINKIIYKIFEITTEKKLIQPTFITEFPIDISPLAKKNNLNKNIADRFELYICGYEIANGFTELNDYKIQKKIFKKQLNKKNKFFYDKEYIEALKYGLPPSSGIGIGIDRLIMILTDNKSIKDVILFPTLK